MPITALPSAPSTDDPENFASESDALVAALATFVTETNALASGLNAIAAGTAFALPYTFSTTTADSDPGAGVLRLDNATQNTATTIRIDTTDAAAADQTNVIATFDDSTSTIKGFIKLVQLNDSTKFLIFSVSALATPSGYRNITVSNVSSSAASPFANNASLVLMFTRTGDKGDTGATGSTPLTYTARDSGSNAQLTAADFASATRISLHWTGSTAFTQTIVAAATVGAGNWLPFKNDSTVTITIDPNASENITGNGATATTLKVYPGEGGILSCDGSAFFVTGLAPKGTPIELKRQSASASAQLDFANIFTSDFDIYKVVITDLKPATDNVSLYVRTSTNGGSSYDAGASDYAYVSIENVTAATSNAATQILVGTGLGNAANDQGLSMELIMHKPSDTGTYFSMDWRGHYWDQGSPPLKHVSGAGARNAAADVDSFRLILSSGNITSGEVVVQGVKK